MGPSEFTPAVSGAGVHCYRAGLAPLRRGSRSAKRQTGARQLRARKRRDPRRRHYLPGASGPVAPSLLPHWHAPPQDPRKADVMLRLTTAELASGAYPLNDRSCTPKLTGATQLGSLARYRDPRPGRRGMPTTDITILVILDFAPQ